MPGNCTDPNTQYVYTQAYVCEKQGCPGQAALISICVRSALVWVYVCVNFATHVLMCVFVQRGSVTGLRCASASAHRTVQSLAV